MLIVRFNPVVCGSCVSSALQWSFQTALSVADFGMSSNKMMMSSIDRGPVYKPRQDVPISCWSVPGALQSLNGMARNWYSPCTVAKAVFSWSAGSTSVARSSVENYCSSRVSRVSSILGSGWASLFIITCQFTLRKKKNTGLAFSDPSTSPVRPDDDQGPCKS